MKRFYWYAFWIILWGSPTLGYASGSAGSGLGEAILLALVVMILGNVLGGIMIAALLKIYRHQYRLWVYLAGYALFQFLFPILLGGLMMVVTGRDKWLIVLLFGPILNLPFVIITAIAAIVQRWREKKKES